MNSELVGFLVLLALLGWLALKARQWRMRQAPGKSGRWVEVTVHADGRVEVGDDVSRTHRERLQTELRGVTGAGDARAWAGWTEKLLTLRFVDDLNVPEAQALPVPAAVRLNILEDALDGSAPLARTLLESEVNFSGQDWRDLLDGLPPELVAFTVPPADESAAEGRWN